MTKKSYYATVEGHINGALRARGDDVGQMTEREAKYALMAGIISETQPDAVAAQAIVEQPAETRAELAPETSAEPAPREEPDPVSLGRKNR